MERISRPMILAILFLYPLASMAQEGPRLEKLWEITVGLATPESVVYDNQRGCLYVSNFNDRGGFRQRTDTLMDEYITRVDLEGKVLDRVWVDGLLGPTGLAIWDDLLYVVERGGLAVVDIPARKIVERIPVPGTVFLNDIVVDKQGHIYLSDSRPEGIVHRLIPGQDRISQGRAEIWLSDTILSGCNGLYLDRDRLLVGTRSSANLVSVSLSDKKISILASSLADGIDGIRKSGEDLILSWRYEILLLENNGHSRLLLSTAQEEAWNADLEYIRDEQMILVPTLLSNSLVAYRLRME